MSQDLSDALPARQLLGVSFFVGHTFLISVMAAMIREFAESFHVMQVLFFYNAFAFLLLLPWVLLKGARSHIRTTKLRWHFARAVLGVISLALYFYAFTVIPLTEARAIALTGPLISSLMAIAFLKERAGLHRWIALLVGFAGALIIIRPGTADFSVVSLLVVIAVFMWSVIDIIIKKLSKSESTTTQLFWLTGLMGLFSAPAAAYVWQTPESATMWFWLVVLGAIFLVNVCCVFLALKHGDVTVLMPFDFMGMVFTAIIAYIAFQEVIEPWTLAGSIVIVISSVYVAQREAVKAKTLHAKPPQSEV